MTSSDDFLSPLTAASCRTGHVTRVCAYVTGGDRGKTAGEDRLTAGQRQRDSRESVGQVRKQLSQMGRMVPRAGRRWGQVRSRSE